MDIKLSVIVPVYNVSNYLEECLDSIITQQVDGIEIIVVDDGSTDNSLEIARRYEEQNIEVKVIAQKNGGLGNARNTGMSAAKGEYLTFVDSDDIIPSNSYNVMLKKIEESQSDFVIGNVIRFNSTKRYASVLHKRIFKEELTGVNIKTNPELIYDTTAWNKIFRKTFWEKHHFTFPERMLYEDIPVTIPAHTLAEKVDVITKVTYKWRSRDAGDSSITQQRENIDNFRDRVKAIEMVRDFFKENKTDATIVDSFDLKNFSMDFPIYMKYMNDVSEEYRKLFFDYISKYMDEISKKVFLELTVLQRLKYKLILEKKYDEFFALLKNDKNKKNILLPVRYKNGLSFNYDFIDVLNPEERMAGAEFIPVNWVEKAFWVNDKLKIEGVLYLKSLSLAKKSNIKIKPFLINRKTNDVIPIKNKVKTLFRPDVTLKRGVDTGSRIPFKRRYNYNFSGFQLEISFDQLQENMSEKDDYSIMFQVESFGITKEVIIGSPLPGFKTKPKFQAIKDCSLVPSYNAAWELVIKKVSRSIKVEDVNDFGEQIVLSGRLVKEITCDRALLVNLTTNEEESLDIKLNDKEFSLVVSKEFLFNHYKNLSSTSWRLFIVNSDGEKVPMYVDEQLVYKTLSLENIQMTITHNKNGEFQLRISDYLPMVQKIETKENSFDIKVKVLKTVLHNAIDKKVILKGNMQLINCDYSIHAEDDDNYIINISIPLNKENIELFEEKRYNLFIQTHVKRENEKVNDSKGDYSISSYDLNSDNEVELNSISSDELNDIETNYEQYTNNDSLLIKNIPVYLFNREVNKQFVVKEGIRYELYQPRGKATLSFRRFSYWTNLDNGPRRKEVVKKILYPLWRRLPLKKNVAVYESFWGREFSDNPKALYEYISQNKPDVKNIIIIRDTLTPIKISANTEIVKYKSWKYYYYLARGKYFFNNVNFPDEYIKRKGVIEVQTMHGTPLKKLGLDNPGEIPENKINKFIEKCRRWDYLTVPSDYVGEIAKSAYKYTGKILNTGYPRNDILFSNEKTKNIIQLKQDYHIPADKKVILYAPTWRVKGKFSMPIDMNLLKDQLGDEYVLVVKLHHFMEQNFSTKGLEDFVYIFGKNHDISDLYILSDVLITDYSSVMFDYALLNKPMIFYAFDYDNYKKNQRDIYFDFQKEAPGAFISTSDEIVYEIKNIENYSERYKDKIKEFNYKYNQYDEGNASEQVSNIIFKDQE